MVRNFALLHEDDTLKYLCQLFLERKLPKAAMDSSKSILPLSRKFKMEFTRERIELPVQMELVGLLPAEPAHIDTVLADVREFVAGLFKSSGLPPDAARYLVVYDPATFEAGPLNDIRFSFEGKVMPLPTDTPESVGFDVSALLSSFLMTRLFVPRNCVDQVREYIDRRYAVRDNSSADSRGEDD